MRVCLIAANGESSIEHEHTTVGPWRQESTLIGRRFEVREIVFQGGVDVLQRRWGRGGWADGEAEAMSLVGIVVWILTQNDCFYLVQRSMTRPVDSIVNAVMGPHTCRSGITYQE